MKRSIFTRALSLLTALLLAVGLPVQALAEEYDLANGSISVTTDSTDQYVTQSAAGHDNIK